MRNNFVFLAISLLFFTESYSQATYKQETLEKASKILKEEPLTDTHNDLPWVIRIWEESPMDVEGYDLRKTTPHETDIERLREGGVGVQYWSVYVPAEIESGFATFQLEQFDIAHRIIERYPEVFEIALTATDIERIKKSGKIASLLGMEGGHVIENSLGALRSFYRLGARYMTLSHNVTLDWVDSATDEAKHGGLTDFGKEVVKEMNRLGMMVDISHVSPEVMHDVLDISEAPVIFSHSSARALTDHPRNVPDDVLRRLVENNGVINVNFYDVFISEELRQYSLELNGLVKGLPYDNKRKAIVDEYYRTHQPVPQATLEGVADHLDHIKNVIGSDYIGIGADYYGGGNMPVGLEDVSKYPYLFAELIERGWTENELKKLAGQNMLRVLKENEEVAKKLQAKKSPSIVQYE